MLAGDELRAAFRPQDSLDHYPSRSCKPPDGLLRKDDLALLMQNSDR